MASFEHFSNEKKRNAPAFRPRSQPAYHKWRRDDLYHLAKQCGIDDRANMTNDELANALRRAQGTEMRQRQSR